MPQVPIPLFSSTYANARGEELKDQATQVMDAYIDELGYVNRRPGLFPHENVALAGPAQALFWWTHKRYVIAIAGGQMYRVDFNQTSDGVVTATALGGDTLTAYKPASITTDGTYVFAAVDGQIIYSDGSSAAQYLADADAPTQVSHVAYIDGYILANSVDSNTWYHSDVNSSLSWGASNIFTASRDPDSIVAIKVIQREIFLFGKRTTEIWENDGLGPFVNVPGGVLETGCIAPYSIVITEDGIFWLNDKQVFTRWFNGQLVRLSTPFDKEIQEFSTVNDCRGEYIEIVGQRFIKFDFPSEGRTLIYSIKKDEWYEFGFWDSNYMGYQRFRGGAYCFAPEWKKLYKHLFADRETGELYWSSDRIVFTDTTNNTIYPIRTRYETGHLNFGTNERKRSNSVTIRVKRGPSSTSDLELTLRYQDDNGPWSNEIPISLGKTGEVSDITRRLPLRGIFRTRKFEFVCTDNAALFFGEAFMDVDVLSR